MFAVAVPGPTELIIMLVIILLLFGGSKLPKLARSLGEAKNEFDKTSRPEAVPPSASPAISSSPGEQKVTMSKADLEALLAKRDAAAHDAATPKE